MRDRYQRIVIPLLLTLFLLFPAASAEAAAPEDEPIKGLIPASSCVLEKEYFADGEQFEPVPVEADTLFIGLSYDNSAVDEATFENAEGLGFRIGSFDGQRVFHASFETVDTELIIRNERNWYLLLDEVYHTEDEAQTSAARYFGKVVKIGGELRVLMGPYKNEQEVEYTIRWYALAGRAWHESCISVYDGDGRYLAMLPDADEIAVEAISEGIARTNYQNEQYFGAFLLRKWEEERLTVINVVGLEDYVKGVIPYEMSSSWPIEALKAQAVCARSYAAYHLGEYEEEFGFDLTDDTESQVYRGIYGSDAVTDAAVEATAGQFVRYQGRLCEVYYFASDGGTTEDGAHIFGSEQPYLAGKTDPFEPALDFAVMRWERWRSGDEIVWRLQQKGYEISSVTSIEPVYSELGNVIGMRYVDAEGNCLDIETRDSYSPLYLDSACFSVRPEDDGFRFAGKGWGHNCGMSQWGANAMASVYGFTADEIIGFYFTGAYIG